MSKALTKTATIEERYAEAFAESRRLYERACKFFPSGVTHDERYMVPFPPYVTHASGSKKWTVEGHELIDYWMGHGALLLGHCHPKVMSKVAEQAMRGTHLGACHELEIEWAEWVRRLMPSAERVRFVASGTEATLMALRLSRMFTGKRKVIKFFGHFHGWHDNLMPAIDPPFDVLDVPGVLKEVQDTVIVLPPNDIEAVEKTLEQDKDIACVILEPTGAKFGAIPTGGEFLKALREVTARHGVLLIFDEVITGFRVHPGGAQGLYGIKPDLTTLAKILAGGLPGGAVAGRKEILDLLAWGSQPKMRHPGTFNANPLSATAGIETLKIVATGEPCEQANRMGALLRQQIRRLIKKHNLNWCCYGAFSEFKILTHYDGERSYDDDFVPYGGDYRKLVESKDHRFISAFRMAMLLHGVDVPGFRGMTSSAHTEEDIQKTVTALEGAIELLKGEGLV